jgi:hypothetical protein
MCGGLQKNEGQVCHRQSSLLEFEKHATAQRMPKPETPNVICQNPPEVEKERKRFVCAHPAERNNL